jgi:hypothetical protein
MTPSHIAYVVAGPRDGRDRNRATWREVGILFPHKSGKGWDLLLHPQVAVSGRIVITERRESDKPTPSDEAGAERGP